MITEDVRGRDIWSDDRAIRYRDIALIGHGFRSGDKEFYRCAINSLLLRLLLLLQLLLLLLLLLQHELLSEVVDAQGLSPHSPVDKQRRKAT